MVLKEEMGWGYEGSYHTGFLPRDLKKGLAESLIFWVHTHVLLPLREVSAKENPRLERPPEENSLLNILLAYPSGIV
jgi:hypothetical protein